MTQSKGAIVYPQVRLEELLVPYRDYVDEPDPRMYPKLSVKLYGRGVTLDDPADGSLIKMRRHQIAKAGQVILSEIWGKKGAIGLVPVEGDGALCTSHFFLFNVKDEFIDPKYLQAIFTANYLESQLGAEAKGTTGYAATRPKHLLAATIPLPSLAEQRRIVARIEELAAKIEAARGLRREVAEDARRLLASQYRRIVEDAEWHPMGDVAPIVRRPVQVEPLAEYRELGIRSFGNGTFHKDPVQGLKIGSKRLFRIEPGDLVFSNVFAWEGAVAVARPEDAGRVGSHRFITCVARPDMATPRFLRFHFLTPKGLSQLGEASPGGAGRNRTLGLQALERIEVPVPSLEAQRWFGRLQENFSQMSSVRAETQSDFDALLPAILDRAFRGEL